MAPYALPEDLANETWEPSAGFVLVDEGIYKAAIFDIEKKSNNKGNYYKLTFRIDGTEFDGEDVIEQYVGLQKDSIFRLYDILTAIGTIGTYYNAETHKWTALPTPEELQGKGLYVKVEHEPFRAVKDGQPQWNEDGTEKWLQSSKPTRYFPLSQPKPEFVKSRKTPAPVTGGQQSAPAIGGAANVVAGLGGVEVPVGAPAAGPDPVW